MWREGDLFRQREAKERGSGGLDGMLGSLALGKQADSKRVKRHDVAQSKGAAEEEDEADEAEGRTTQGDRLRAARTKGTGRSSKK